MYQRGVVKINDDEVGVFFIDQEDRISITFDKGAAGVEETLEWAAEQGLNFGLQLMPEYNGEKD